MNLLVLTFMVILTIVEPLEYSRASLEEWELFKIAFTKNYESVEEHDRRQIIFLHRLKKLHHHNLKFKKRQVTYKVGINQFTDWTEEERRDYLKVKIPTKEKTSVNMFDMPEHMNLPRRVDWRKVGAVTPVKDQRMCGSCWAFSATGALEGQYFLKTKKLVSFSEQNLVDCSRDEGNAGCDGGWPDQAYDYIIKNKGIDTEESYPYRGFDSTCRYNNETRGASITSSTDVTYGNETKLQQAVAKVGPISVCIDAGGDGFMDYKSGLYNEPHCLNNVDELDHCLLAVGYGTQKKGGDYWLVKNSWNTSWGMKGYIMMSRNKNNQCGIATQAQYPVL